MSKEPGGVMQHSDPESGQEECNDIKIKQDNYRNIVFGQISDGLLPPHPDPPETTDDELSRAALADTEDIEEDEQRHLRPTAWRAIFLAVIITTVLAIVLC